MAEGGLPRPHAPTRHGNATSDPLLEPCEVGRVLQLLGAEPLALRAFDLGRRQVVRLAAHVTGAAGRVPGWRHQCVTAMPAGVSRPGPGRWRLRCRSASASGDTMKLVPSAGRTCAALALGVVILPATPAHAALARPVHAIACDA